MSGLFTDLATLFLGIWSLFGFSSSLSRPLPRELLSALMSKKMEPMLWNPPFKVSSDDTKTEKKLKKKCKGLYQEP